MSWFLIPLTTIPQVFQITLAGINYLMTVRWNDAYEGGWQFTLVEADTDTIILAGAPFVTGTDLLANLGYLGINGSLFVYTEGNEAAVPTFVNLGTESNLYFVTEVEANG